MYNENKKLSIFLVDDDRVFLKLLSIEFQLNFDCVIQTFATGELCLKAVSQNPDLIVLDYHLDGIEKNAMNGIETLDRIKVMNARTPVIMLSSQDSIDVAVDCMHHKALDYVVKSETYFFRLKHIIESLFKQQKLETTLDWYMQNQ